MSIDRATLSAALTTALQADGFTVTADGDGGLLVSVGAHPSLKIFLDRFLNSGDGSDVSLAVDEVLTQIHSLGETRRLLEQQAPQLMGALWPHLTLASRVSDTGLVRTLIGPLVESLALNLPSHFALLTTEALSHLHLSTDTAWPLAEARRDAQRCAPDHEEPLTDGATAYLWTGSDAADQAWATASAAAAAYFAPLSSEHAWVVQGARDLSPVLPLAVYAAQRRPEPQEHPLLPHVLQVEHGRIVGSVQALPDFSSAPLH